MYHAVLKEDAIKVARDLHAEYFEVSAKTGVWLTCFFVALLATQHTVVLLAGDGVAALFSRIAYVLLRMKISSQAQNNDALPSSSTRKGITEVWLSFRKED